MKKKKKKIRKKVRSHDGIDANHVLLGPENFVVELSFCIPRKFREPLVRELLEDCFELRARGKIEIRIWVHVFWQLLIAVFFVSAKYN